MAGGERPPLGHLGFFLVPLPIKPSSSQPTSCLGFVLHICSLCPTEVENEQAAMQVFGCCPGSTHHSPFWHPIWGLRGSR